MGLRGVREEAWNEDARSELLALWQVRCVSYEQECYRGQGLRSLSPVVRCRGQEKNKEQKMSKKIRPGQTPETDAVVRRWVDSDELSVKLTMKCMELETRLQEALTELDEQSRLLGMSGSREASLNTKIFELERRILRLEATINK